MFCLAYHTWFRKHTHTHTHTHSPPQVQLHPSTHPFQIGTSIFCNFYSLLTLWSLGTCPVKSLYMQKIQKLWHPAKYSKLHLQFFHSRFILPNRGSISFKTIIPVASNTTHIPPFSGFRNKLVNHKVRFVHRGEGFVDLLLISNILLRIYTINDCCILLY